MCAPFAKVRAAGARRLRTGAGVATLAATAAAVTRALSRSPAAPGASTWFGTGRRRDETPGQRGEGRSRWPSLRLPTRPGAAPAPSLAAIGPRGIRAVPLRHRYWLELELGGARAALSLARARVGRCSGPGNSAPREGARAGGGLGAKRGSSSSLVVSVRLHPRGGREATGWGWLPTPCPVLSLSTYGKPWM